MKGTSSDTEDGRSFSDEDGVHNVENFVPCSFAHHACSPLLQRCSHEEAVKDGLDVSLLIGRVIPPSRLSGTLCLQFS